MSRALELAEKGRFTTHPNPRVGCVITRNGKVLGTGWHVKAGMPHAEINAINDASCDLRGATAYVSLEPCSHHGRTPPCIEAIIRSGISRVVIAAPDPNPQVSGAGIKALREAGISVDTGLMAEQANELNKGFIYRMTRARPYVRCKTAVSVRRQNGTGGRGEPLDNRRRFQAGRAGTEGCEFSRHDRHQHSVGR